MTVESDRVTVLEVSTELCSASASGTVTGKHVCMLSESMVVVEVEVRVSGLNTLISLMVNPAGEHCMMVVVVVS